MTLSLFAPPLCPACAAPSCPGVSALASCPAVAAASAALVAAAPAAAPLPVVVPAERAALLVVAVRLAHDDAAPLASCPACSRRVVGRGVAALPFLAGAPLRLAPGPLARRRAGLWCPICGRAVFSGAPAPVVARLRRFLAAA